MSSTFLANLGDLRELELEMMFGGVENGTHVLDLLFEDALQVPQGDRGRRELRISGHCSYQPLYVNSVAGGFGELIAIPFVVPVVFKGIFCARINDFRSCTQNNGCRWYYE